MAKIIKYETEARDLLKKGVDALANASDRLLGHVRTNLGKHLLRSPPLGQIPSLQSETFRRHSQNMRIRLPVDIFSR